jgi:hypothetical protein
VIQAEVQPIEGGQVDPNNGIMGGAGAFQPPYVEQQQVMQHQDLGSQGPIEESKVVEQ